MCARLSRCFRALDDMVIRKRNGQNVLTLQSHDDRDADAFVEQHWALCSVTPWTGEAQFTHPDMSDAPLEAGELQLIRALIDTEKFMRLTVNDLHVFKAIEPDTRYFTPIPDTALRWVFKALDLAATFRHCLDPDSASYQNIAQQNLRLTTALSKFLQLLSVMHTCRQIWRKRPLNCWTWPELECLDQPLECDCCPYSDLVAAIEEIQQLLVKQDDSRDRLKRSNLSTARNVAAQAFSRSSKVLVIRIDLGFRQGVFQNTVPPPRGTDAGKLTVNISQVRKCFRAFILYVTKQYGFARLGYINKVEYGPMKGYHHHLIILLNGHKHQQDVNIAKQLGEHWANVITAGQGVYHNCNAKKERYAYKGIGMIERNDSEKRKIFETKVIEYLVKYDLPFQLLKDGKFRQFSTSCCK